MQMTYMTWPLSLNPEDLKLLTPLENLRCLKLLAHEDEEHQLLALTRGVLASWQAAFQHLTCLHFSGRPHRTMLRSAPRAFRHKLLLKHDAF